MLWFLERMLYKFMNAGKGDKYRPVDKDKFNNNFDKINWSKWYVYIIECSDGTLYCGVTNRLDNRIDVHNKGKGAKYTRGRLPVRLVYEENFNNKSSAFKRESEIKHFSREKKICLINGYNLKEY